MMFPLVLDIAIILLLVITLIGGVRLHKQLRMFRVEREEFEPLIHALDNASKRAETVLSALRQIADDVGGKLNAEAANTQRMLDELDFMTKRADQLADRLDGAISDARKKEGRKPPEAPVNVATRQDEAPSIEPRRRPPDLEKRLKALR